MAGVILMIKGKMRGSGWTRVFDTNEELIRCNECLSFIKSGEIIYVCPGGEQFCKCTNTSIHTKCIRSRRGTVHCEHQRGYLNIVKEIVGLEPVKIEEVEEEND